MLYAIKNMTLVVYLILEKSFVKKICVNFVLGREILSRPVGRRVCRNDRKQKHIWWGLLGKVTKALGGCRQVCK